MVYSAWFITTPANWEESQGSKGITGYWNTIDGKTVFSMVGGLSEIESIRKGLDIPKTDVYLWEKDTGYDAVIFDANGELEEDGYIPVPDRVLSFMPDIKEYDDAGNVVSSVSPDFSLPNWSHVFFGQPSLIFAGDFSDQFTEEYF